MSPEVLNRLPLLPGLRRPKMLAPGNLIWPLALQNERAKGVKEYKTDMQGPRQERLAAAKDA